MGGCLVPVLRRRPGDFTQRLLPLCFGSWQFTCINLWDTCVRRSEDLPSSLANAPLLVRRIDILPVAPKAGLLYLDEIILADTSITGDCHICCPLGPASQMPVSKFHTRCCFYFPKGRLGGSSICLLQFEGRWGCSCVHFLPCLFN